MHFTMSINSNNAALADDAEGELVRLLGDVIGRLESGSRKGGLHDYNGNPVGSFEFTETRYLATVNIPGYLPMDDDPPTFTEARDAWQHLADERVRGEDDAWEDGQDEGYSATHSRLESLGNGMHSGTESDYANAGIDPVELTGSVHGPTPGYQGEHDLGLAYTVSLVEE